MNQASYLQNLQELFGDLSALTPEKLQSFVGETMKKLFDLKHQLESSDPKTREEGIRAATELKEALESQLEQMAKLAGVDPAQWAGMLNQTLSDQEQEILQNAKEQFQYLKNSFTSENKKVNNKVNIIG